MANKRKRLARKNNHKMMEALTMEDILKKSHGLGCTNLEVAMKNLSPTSKIIRKHLRAIDKLKLVHKGNKHNRMGNANEARNYLDRKSKIDSCVAWLKINGFELEAGTE